MQKATVQTPSRLDQFVAQAFQLSRAQAQKHIEAGHVRCNGCVIRKVSKVVKRGDRVVLLFQEVSSPQPAKRSIPQYTSILKTPPVPFPVLYEDETCIVVSKPAGIAVHPAPSHRNEPTLIETLRAERGEPDLHLAHRLDKGTTGCLLVAKTTNACEALQKQFKERMVQKTYLAIVAGTPAQRSATIEAPLGRSLVHRTKMTLFRTSKSRHAATSYRVLSEASQCSLLECTIATGRTHQIRVHLSAIGHPVLGDEKYGTEKSKELSKTFAIVSPCLHAWKLSFRSPAAKDAVHVTAPVPDLLAQTTHALGLYLPASTEY